MHYLYIARCQARQTKSKARLGAYESMVAEADEVSIKSNE